MLMILTYLKTIAETDSNGVAKIAQEIIKEPDWFSSYWWRDYLLCSWLYC